jgi:hypothetical protein
MKSENKKQCYIKHWKRPPHSAMHAFTLFLMFDATRWRVSAVTGNGSPDEILSICLAQDNQEMYPKTHSGKYKRYATNKHFNMGCMTFRSTCTCTVWMWYTRGFKCFVTICVLWGGTAPRKASVGSPNGGQTHHGGSPAFSKPHYTRYRVKTCRHLTDECSDFGIKC